MKERLIVLFRFLAILFSFVVIVLCLDQIRLAVEDAVLLLLSVGYLGWNIYAFGKANGEAEGRWELFNDEADTAREHMPEPEGKQERVPEEPYTADERETIERYIGDAFGPIGRTYYDGGNTPPRIDIAVTEPVESRSFYTLTTIGMGAHRMEVPPELAEKNQSFAELTVCLPPDWNLMRDTWPFHVLQETARRPFREHDHISVGSAYRGEMMRGSGFHGVLILPAAVREGSRSRLMLADGKVVNFYLLLPILEEEWNYILARHDSYALWQRYAQRGGSIVVDPARESCVDWAEVEDMTEEESE